MTHKTFLAFLTLAVMMAVAVPAGAMPPLESASLDTPGTSRVLLLPKQADGSPVISLGTAVDPETGKVVEGLAIIHPKRSYDHKPQHNGQRGNGSGTSSCFSYLANGAEWKTVEPWVMNGSNIRGLDPAVLFGLQDTSLIKWEDAADGIVGDGSGVEIFGSGALTSESLVADTESPDGKNEVYFADVSSSGAIAVTIVWGIFSGPPFARELVEWDMVFDDVDFDWSTETGGVIGKMDFDNIATHENGHAAGMGHPDDSCTEETMYRFASDGEINKRTLEAGDVAGVDGLY